MAHFILEGEGFKRKPIHTEVYVYNAIRHTSPEQQVITIIYIILK